MHNNTHDEKGSNKDRYLDALSAQRLVAVLSTDMTLAEKDDQYQFISAEVVVSLVLHDNTLNVKFDGLFATD